MSISMILYKLTSIHIMNIYILSFAYLLSIIEVKLSDDGSNSNLVLSPTLTLIYCMHL